MSTFTEQLIPLLRRPISQPMRARAALHVLDWAGCAVAGLRTAGGRALLRWARARAAHEVGAWPAIGAGELGFDTALLLGGSLGNLLEMDDVHRTAILHPGPVVIPAALCAAIVRGADGNALLDAVVRGYEAMIRVGRSFGPAHYALWHPTSTAGPFGAATAVGVLLGLDDDALVDALGNAGTQSSGPWQTRHEPRSMAKQLHTARAAHAGALAAELAASGFAGPRAILEGPQGLWAATCGAGAMPDRVCSDVEGDWLMNDTSFKPWPACRHAHPTIDAALELRRRLDGAPLRLRVLTYGDAVRFCDRPEPASIIEAKFSLQHAVAVTLVRGAPTLDDFEPAAIADPEIATMRARVEVVRDDAFDNAYPEHYGAALEVVAGPGTGVRVDAPDALGDPACPLDSAAIVGKARRLMAWGGLEDAGAAALVEAVLELPGAPDLERLARCVRATRQ